MPITFLSPRLLGALAALGGLCWIPLGLLTIVRADGVREDTIETTTAHLAIGSMAAALILTVAGLALLARTVPTSRGPLAAGTGQLLLAAAAIVSNVRGEDASWFVIVAPVANALWLFGSIATARALRRAGATRALAFGLPLVWAAAIPFSLLGCAVLAGAYWLVVGLGGVLAAPSRPLVAASAA